MASAQIPRCRVVRGEEVPRERPHLGEPGHGATVSTYLDPAGGGVHVAVAVCELEPGGHIVGHLHPFEESFYVLSGTGVVNIDGRAFSLVPHDFGLVPIAVGHAWRNTGDVALRWLRVHSPVPRPLGSGAGVYAAPAVEPADTGIGVEELDPAVRLLGHFDETELPPPGMISMPGYHGANIRRVSIRMMVDELLGARHHTLFIVQFDPSIGTTLNANEHFHPFEEIYYFLQGQAEGSFDGDREPIAPGDMVYAPVNAGHGFANTGDVPVRWIEAQAPLPPASNGFFFHSDWSKLEPIELS